MVAPLSEEADELAEQQDEEFFEDDPDLIDPSAEMAFTFVEKVSDLIVHQFPQAHKMACSCERLYALFVQAHSASARGSVR